MAIDSQAIAVAADQADLPLSQRIGSFHGHHHDFLLWLIANPSKPQSEGMRSLGLSELTLYSWRRDLAGFKEVIDAVQSYRGDLRSEAAKAMFQSAIVPLSHAMIERGKGQGVAAQRAAERILETVGVLRKDNDQAAQAPVQVVTHTYVLVQPGQEPKTIMVETSDARAMEVKTTVKELGSGQPEHYCQAHSVPLKRFEKEGKSWYAHKGLDGKWCREK